MTADDTKHSVICNDCSKTETAAHESDATCTTAGTCNTCKKSYKNPDNHAGLFTYVYTQSSDESFHTKTEICTGCEKPTGKIITEKHTETIKATCTTAAYCEVCKSNYGNPDTKAHALEHHDAKAATCLEKGWKAYDTCKRCDYSTYQELPKTDHDLKRAQEFTRKPTCTKKGWKSYYLCCNCTYSETEWLNPLGHDWGEWTSNGNGTHTRACKHAGCTETQPGNCSGGTATCTEKAVCSVCKSAYGNPLGHDKVRHDAKAPTCLEKGWKAYDTCTRCDYTTYQELKALGHDKVKHAAKNPTCTDYGWYAYDTCTRCDYSTCLIRPALGHDKVNPPALRSAGRRMTPVRGATIPPTRSCLPSATTTRSACTR